MKPNYKPKYLTKRTVRLLPLILLALALITGLTAALLNWNSRRELDRLAEQVHSQTQPEQTQTSGSEPTQASQPSGTEQTEQMQETEPGSPKMLEQYQSLYEQNLDLYGWITIADTKIDYPVMHTPHDPEKYLHANFEGAYSYAGIPFLEDACSEDSDNLIIYAHNMADGSMFASLMKYSEESYWKEHPTIRFDTLYEEQEYEILAAFYDRVYYKSEVCFKFYKFIDAVDEADFDNAIRNFKKKAIYDTGVTASYGDQLITLVTCAYHVENGRFVVVARRK